MSEQGFKRREVLKATGLVAAGAALGTLAAGEAVAADALPQVPRRKLGKTGKDIPILLMGGSMRFDPRFDPKLAECLRYGVNYFDTADCYAGGTSETSIGAFLQKTKSRDQVWLTTKSDLWDGAGLKAKLAESLERLKTDHVELLYLHGLDSLKPLLDPELPKVVEALKKAGSIHHFGFSCHEANVVELLNKAAGLSWVESIMFRYNFRQYGEAELNKAIDACAGAGIGLIAMKTQGSEALPEKWRLFEKSGKWTKHQAVLKAAWSDPRISACVSQMDTFEKLKANVAAALDRSELGQVEREALQRYADATRAFACDGCDHHCNPHVAAPVRIGATIRCVMYHDVYGQAEEAKARFAQLPAAARRLDGLDFTAAARACPHGVDIPAHLARARELFGDGRAV